MSKQKHGKRYSETEIVRILQEISQGKALAEVARQYGVSENTIYRWKSRYGDMSSAEIQRVRELEAENARLTRMLAEQLMDNDALKELLRKKMVSPDARRQAAQQLVETKRYSQRRACKLVSVARSTARYRLRRTDDPEL